MLLRQITLTMIKSALTLLLGFCLALSNFTPALAQGTSEVKSKKALEHSGEVVWFLPSTLVKYGAIALEEKEFEKAIKMVNDALEFPLLDSDKLVALNTLCIAYVYIHEPEKAISPCSQLIKISEPRWFYYNNRGNAYLAMSKYDRSIADYEMALHLAREREQEFSKEAADASDETKTLANEIKNLSVVDMLPESQISKPTEIVRRNLEIALAQKTKPST